MIKERSKRRKRKMLPCKPPNVTMNNNTINNDDTFNFNNNNAFGSNKDYAMDDELPVEVPAPKACFLFFSFLSPPD